MGRYNTAGARASGRSAVLTEERPTGRTHEGGAGHARDDRSELFLSAVSSFTDNTFYESESARLARQRELIARVAIDDPDWTLGFLRWLRADARIRTASLILAAEAVKARVDAGVNTAPEGTRADPNPRGYNRLFIDAVCQRADEPGEMLAYWATQHGAALPMSVKAGVADAVGRLYTERSLLKYDGAGKAYRFGRVIELTHPRPVRPFQRQLFPYAISRHHNDEKRSMSGLSMIQANERVRGYGPEVIKALAADGRLAEELSEAGMNWEDIPALVNGPWTARLWEAIIPSMGVMALMRNLRNFDAAGVGDNAARLIASRFADAEEVERSRILPMRVLAAYRNAPNVRWVAPLEAALQNSLANIPALDGHTLILVDRSASMFNRAADRSQLNYADTAAIFGTALALRAQKSTLVQFGTTAATVEVPKGGSVLPMLDRFYELGGTNTARAIREHLTGAHTRVVILTDEQHAGYQTSYSPETLSQLVPGDVPMHTFNLVGYRYGHTGTGHNRFTYGGLSDSSWSLLELTERGAHRRWPWQA
ncbi:Ro-like RNA binding protein [Gordonia phage VanLee]|uniref:Ro-like RNA binding protein n=1 Tax=Gordonia phage VanLee TaxID=2845816 RepID=A0A8F2D9K0_9CAUD|nr:Ro-like RNA binding protein [Gordonia phage VanLee]QWS68242.1 Ro-like RNA binding protein [Gordonia phage VanLee]